ncbi:MAG: RNA-binding protein [Candidatus Shapirobacteria bacterium]|nr:RNA-binding protein [Candidatus Shapirobacteria bacterium]MDD4410630.1 RNA-binding protein [Candidatus Shapirobacteria bacterium]
MSLPKPVSKRLFIGSLPYRFTEGELLSLFVAEGKIISVRIMHNQWGKSRGIGFVEFENLDDAIRAKTKYHNYYIGDRTIIVDYAEADPFLTAEGQARHEEALKDHPNRRQPQPFLPHPDSDLSDYQAQKRSLDNRQYPPRPQSISRPSSNYSPVFGEKSKSREYKGGKPVFNSVGKSLNRNTTGEYIPKFFPDLNPNKKKFRPKPGQKPEYKSSSDLHVRSSVFKQRNFGSKVGAKFAFKSKKNK